MAEQQKKPAQKQNKPANDNAKNSKSNNDGNKKPNDNKAQKGNGKKLLEYKGKPLVRSGKKIYYGNVNDAYIICLNIKDSKDYKDITLAGNIVIQLLSTDESLSPKEQIIKKSEKNGLFNALDLGATWLERQLKKG